MVNDPRQLDLPFPTGRMESLREALARIVGLVDMAKSSPVSRDLALTLVGAVAVAALAKDARAL